MLGNRRRAEGPRATILIRFFVGVIFFEEGLQKFLFPHIMGAGVSLGSVFPRPAAAPFVAAIETACGLMLIIGLLTRLAAVPLLMDIIAAILATKPPNSH